MIYSLVTWFYYIKIMQVFLYLTTYLLITNIQVQIIDAPGKVILFGLLKSGIT